MTDNIKTRARLAALVFSSVLGTVAALAAAGEDNAALLPDDVAAADVVEWVAGQTRPLPGLADGDWLGIPGAATGPKGFFFGAGAAAGPRHFRVGFVRDVALGTVVTRGQGRLSVLRPKVAYPGDPAQEADWLPAERLRERQISVWTLPPGTATRALRHSPHSV